MTDGHEIIASIGGPVAEVMISFGLFGVDLDPAEISRKLGCEPSTSRKRGDARRAAGPAVDGCWLLTADHVAPDAIDDAIQSLLARIKWDDASIWSELRNAYTVRLQIGVFVDQWVSGFDLSRETVQQIVAVGASIGIGVYSESGEEPDGSR